MNSSQKIRVNDIHAVVFDFDGVLTNNIVHLDQNGNELVSCSRGDGLAFEVLKKIKIPAFILSTEKNPVVSARARKLGIPALQGCHNKVEGFHKIALEYGLEISKILYVGNDVNDYRVMQLSGFSACPADSHKQIQKIATVILKKNGGNGVVRELLEEVLDLDFVKILY